MAPILEKLELERPIIITSESLSEMLRDEGIKTPVSVFATRLKEKGWLLTTPKRGVWEFVPASSAGAYSANDPLLIIKSIMSKHSPLQFGLTFQAAAWMHGTADRVPTHLEVAAVDTRAHRIFQPRLSTSMYKPNLMYDELKGIPVLAPESVIIHMTEKPRAVRSWQSSLEWLPDLAELLKVERILEEISNRYDSVIARVGYLLQGMRPDIAEILYQQYTPKNKTWFGSRAPLLRHDNKWLIADTMLPFDPRKIGVVK